MSNQTETVFRLRRHPDQYWVVYGKGNRRLACIVMPIASDRMGIAPSLADVVSAVREYVPTYHISAPRIVIDEVASPAGR